MAEVRQTARDLRAVVARRVGTGRRVALLSGDATLRTLLEQNRCTVLADPPGFAELSAFAPQVVVGFDGLLAEGARGVEALRAAAPEAELVLSFANPAAASTLVRALAGESTPAAASELDVRAWLRASGWVVESRDPIVTGVGTGRLSADTESALRGLFEQLHPDAAADRFVVVARRGVEPSPVDRVAGLTTLIVAGAELHALEGTLKSIAGQLHQPLDVLVATSRAAVEVEPLCAPLKGRAGFSVSVLEGAGHDPLEATNAALVRARGQYLGCLEAGELLDRAHVGGLVDALKNGTVAWALSGAPGLEGPFALHAWLDAAAVHRGRWLVDRERLGAFSLSFAAGLPLAEAVLFARLAALFTPAVVGKITLDSPRRPASSVTEVLSATGARPLRSLTDALRAPAQVELVEVLLERLSARSGTAAQLVRRVIDAARDARQRAADDRRSAQ
ncbi:MAG: hypothetical protein U0228_29775 [Myxococcaceae bacterium]